MASRFSESLIEEIRGLKEAGLSNAEIAKKLSISKNSAQRYTSKMTFSKQKCCSKCGKNESETTFYKRGLVCKLCAAIDRKKHYQKNKQYYLDKSNRHQQKIRDYIKKYKEEHPCADCGNFFMACAMDFDHLHSKEYEIAHAYNKVTSIKSLMLEINKCDLVCAVCHRIRTYTRQKNS